MYPNNKTFEESLACFRDDFVEAQLEESLVHFQQNSLQELREKSTQQLFVEPSQQEFSEDIPCRSPQKVLGGIPRETPEEIPDSGRNP